MANHHLLWSKLCLAFLLLFMGLQQVSLGIRYEGLGIRVGRSVMENQPLGIRYWGIGLRENPSIDPKRMELQRIFRAEVGVREATGRNDGVRVAEYLAITNLSMGHAWCSSYISWVFAQAGYTEPRTPWSPALFPKNRVIWEKGKQNAVVKTGDIFGLWLPNLGRIAHAGFIDEWGETFFKSIEGNTNEAGSNEGDGVYRKRRRVNSVHQVANWVDEPTR